MDRRHFIRSGVAVAIATSWANAAVQTGAGGATGSHGLQAANDSTSVDHHRFGVNYTPSQDWWFCWNNWRTDPIKRDLDAISELGADHLRIMLIWPFFQPNPKWVSDAHIDRLNQLLTLIEERNLSALVTVFNGWLSGWFFAPPFMAEQSSALYTDPKVWAAQEILIRELARTLKLHNNIIGFDFGNEMNVVWRAETPVGDAWMKKMLMLMNAVCPGKIHVNGTDHQPWFRETTFSPHALASTPLPVIHAYPYWTKALQYGGPMDPPSTRLICAFAALIRAYAGNPQKRVWAGEFNTCIESMSDKQQAAWLETAVVAAIQSGISWFTYWDSHDVSSKFTFDSLEYRLGLLTNDGRVKEQGRVFRQLADSYRNKPVAFPTHAPPPPPTERNWDSTWKWMLDFLSWKPRSV